jgi:hypothetical protein
MHRATNIIPGVLRLGYHLVQVWSQSDEWWLRGVRCKRPPSACFGPPPPAPPERIFAPAPRQACCPFPTRYSKSSP